jgi:ATP-dependent Clp protease ATP-binding subunit ClpA
MASFPAPLDNLIAYVRTLHPDGGPLDRLSDAVTAADELNEQADALIGYFVDQARASGASWSQIGAAMGVSKQAAQKRFVARDDEPTAPGKAFSRFTPRARAAVAAAGQLAANAGEDEVGVAHLVAGCLHDNGGVAARALQRLEVDEASVYEALGSGPARGGSDADPTALRRLHFAASCREAFRDALKAALRLGHNYIGTEHLLLGAVASGGDVAERLRALGLSVELIDSAVAVELAEFQLLLRRRPT